MKWAKKTEKEKAGKKVEKKGIKKTALGMLKHGMKMEDVAAITDPSIEELKEIRDT